MTDRHERITDLFARALARPDEDRTDFVRSSDEDTAVRDEVLALLAHDRADLPALEPEAVRDRLGAVAAQSLADERERPMPARIGAFRIVRVLGEGGMGIVYEAEQDEPRRRVALKVIHPGGLSRRTLRRFREEVDVMGQLQHPGIARILEAGSTEAGPYFAMELVDGTPLLEHARARGLARGARLGLIARVADAVHHAHQHGVIHRDLKPSNILVDADGQPKVLDFGVARLDDRAARTATGRTVAGELVGTIPYMSPEQATADPVALDVRSDVYSIGVLGYELLGGRLPYDVRDRPMHEAVRVVREREPTRLGAVDPALRGDVETIFAKALEKEKHRRYQSAAELAADIRRHLADEPIAARPATVLYQARKFARRHRTVVAAAAIIALALVAATAVSLRLAAVARAAEHEAGEQGEAASRQRDRAEASLVRALQATCAAAATALDNDETATARALLDSIEPARRNWEWRRLDARFDRAAALVAVDEPILDAALAPDGRLATVSPSGALRWWDPGTGELRRTVRLPANAVRRARFDRAAARLVGVTDAGPALWATSDGALLDGPPASDDDPTFLALEGRRVLLGDPTRVRVRDGGRILDVDAPPTDRLGAATLGRDGMLATATRSGDVILRPADGRPAIQRWSGGAAAVTGLALDPTGRRIAVVSGDRIRVQDVDGAGAGHVLVGHTGPVRDLAFDERGERLASAGDETVRLWSAATGEPLRVFSGHRGPVRTVRFVDDDRMLLSTSDDGTARLWALEPADDPSVLRGHSLYVYGAAPALDGRRIVSGSWDESVRIWSTETREPLAVVRDPLETVYSVGVAPDGRTFATGTWKAVAIRDAETGATRRRLGHFAGQVNGVAFSPDGTRLAVTAKERALSIIDLDGERRLDSDDDLIAYHGDVAWTPDGRTVVVAAGPLVAAYDATTLALRWRRTGAPLSANCVAVRPGGGLFATGDDTGRIRLWTPDGDLHRAIPGRGVATWGLAFTPDGTRLAAGDDDGTIRILDAEHGPVATLHGHDDYVYTLAFTADGAQLVSGSGDGTVRIWDTEPRWRLERIARAARARRAAVAPRARAVLAQHEDLPAAIAALRGDPAWTDDDRTDAIEVLLRDAVVDATTGCAPFEGHALRFGGAGAFVQLVDDADSAPTDAFTIELWVRPDGVRGTLERMGVIAEGEGRFALARFRDGHVAWTLGTPTSTADAWVDSGWTAPPDAWSHLALVHDGRTTRLYADGRLQHEATEAPTTRAGDAGADPSRLRLGDRRLGGLAFAGSIDEVRRWSVARSGSEIAASMRRAVPAGAPGLVGCWHFDEGTGDAVTDAVAGRTGVLVGARWQRTEPCPPDPRADGPGRGTGQ